jgi:hypothetical protein
MRSPRPHNALCPFPLPPFPPCSRITLNTVVEAPNVKLLHDQWQEHQAQHAAHSADEVPDASANPVSPSYSSQSASSLPPGSADLLSAPTGSEGPYTAHAALKCMLPGHDVLATLGYNLDYIDNAGDYAHVPLAASLDLASQDRADGLQYRVGLHQVRGCMEPPSCVTPVLMHAGSHGSFRGCLSALLPLPPLNRIPTP